ncbi:FtsK/SpoIIIE domain-containing protein [Trueperella sp. LYQ141]|uniref:FtsK/SpoIIIE domain-containing protein n=1 Tax=Trueperella sp. LYQ141 TaxID=3391058 RepID=UPI003983D048
MDIALPLASPHHLLISGRTRSGKSVLLYSVLAQLAARDEVLVGGVDPSGIVFNALGSFPGEEFRALTLRDPHRCLAVLAGLVEVMDQRIQALLRDKLDKFTTFSREFPLLLVVLEEYPGLLAALEGIDRASGVKPAERIEPQVRALVQRLALEGAKVGVRLVVVTQRADATILTGVLRSQLSVKFAFAQDADGFRMLFPELPEDLKARSVRLCPGEALVELPGAPVGLFKADFIDYPGLVDRFAAAGWGEGVRSDDRESSTIITRERGCSVTGGCAMHAGASSP